MDIYLIALDTSALLGTAGNILKVALGLGFVIFVHELGHFLAAKACGVKCEKFYIGFDVPISIGPIRLPRTLGKFRWGETEYGIGILPLGGYVKMLGQDDDPRKAVEEAERIKQAGGDGAEAFKLDPRSYPAKTVPQRMLIISAGVIMNLIFAVIFAATAFRFGVDYMPCEVAAALPGSPAWTAGFEPGDKIIQIGKSGRPSEHLRHDWDLRQSIGVNGDKEDLPFLVRHVDGQEEWLVVRPFAAVINGSKGLPAIGVRQGQTLQVGAHRLPGESFDGDDEESSGKRLPAGDWITAIDGRPVKSALDVEAALLAAPDKPLKFTTETRAASDGDGATPKVEKTTETIVAPLPRRRYGLVVNCGPIAVVRRGSPAEKAGLQVGDRIQSINGEALVDVVALPDQMHRLIGQEIEIKVLRGKSEEPVVVKLTPAPPKVSSDLSQPGMPVGIDSLGIALPAERTIAAVVPGSVAEQKGIKPGDKLVRGQFKHKDAKKSTSLTMKGEEFEFEDQGYHAPMLESMATFVGNEIPLQLKVERGTELISVELTPTDTDGFMSERGVFLTGRFETRVAESWGEAFGLGARQTLEDASRVWTFLKRLVTGKIALSNVGGPGSIATMAGIEASKGISSLLIFLTLLSANLAVLNFMPVPALDGGHMVFLLWEGLVGPVNERVQMALTMAGVACLLCLMVVVSSMDVWRLFQWLGG